MTMPDERTRAIFRTRDFLRRLLSPYNGGIKRIPKEVRREAYYLLKHFPHEYDLIRAEPNPDVFDVEELEKRMNERKT